MIQLDQKWNLMSVFSGDCTRNSSHRSDGIITSFDGESHDFAVLSILSIWLIQISKQ